MSPPTTAHPAASLLPGRGGRWSDEAFRWLALSAAIVVVGLIVLVGWELYRGARLSVQQFGGRFFVSSKWDPVSDIYGALPFIYGTLVSSFLALVIAVPLGVGAALFLTEIAPVWLRQPAITLIEMLAAVPSVIFGLWVFLS